VQSDKATVEITSRYDGVVKTVHHEEGNIVKVSEERLFFSFLAFELLLLNCKVGSTLVDIETSSPSSVVEKKHESEAPSAKAKDPALPGVQPAPQSYTGDSKVLTTPAVRKLAKENKLDLSKLIGTGPKGRIIKGDVLRSLFPERMGEVLPSPQQSVVSSHAPLISGNQQVDQKLPIRGVQRLMVKSMAAANQVFYGFHLKFL
jgi:2-oxoisovalerate dehydrogenase E2 component (dihydrolipoyl transacylase)